MKKANPFLLESLPYQTDAVEAVVGVFEGTSRPAPHEFAGNRCTLPWSQIRSNLQSIAQRHRISDERLNISAPEQGQQLDVCVEMETGTGKTLVYGYNPQPIDAGFKVFTLEKTVFPRADFAPDPSADEAEQLAALKAFIADKEASLFDTLDTQSVRDEVLLKCGFQLDVRLTPIAEVKANKLYSAKDQQNLPREAIVCFDNQLDTTTLEWLCLQKGQRVIVLEAALDTTGKWNLHHQLGDGLVVF